jgi:glycosyltransferase involved in cell wall biosynthesis
MTTPRILIIAEALPYPTYKGGDLRNWQNANGLAKIGEVGIFGLCSNDHRAAQIPRGIALWRASTDPALAYPPPQGRKLKSRAWAIEPLGHPSDLSYSEAAAAEIETVIAEFRPDILVIEGLWLHRYIAHVRRRHCHVVLDCHNVETALFQQRADAARGSDLKTRLIREILPARTAVIERKALHAVDQVWACSDADARLIAELHRPSTPVWMVPNGLDLATYETRHNMLPDAGDASKQSIIFPATFAYWPNAAAASFLIREVFPLLAGDSPDYQLLLVGNRPTPAMLQAAREDPRIVVTDIVPDVRPYLAAASVLLVPLFEGGGTRFKILEAFAARIPVVSTAKGAEGLQVRDEVHLLMAENAEQMAAAVRRISSDKCLRQRLTRNGWELLERCYSWNVAAGRISEAVADLRAGASRSEKGNSNCETASD